MPSYIFSTLFDCLTSLSIFSSRGYSGVSQFVLIDPKPSVLDRDAHDAAEKERLRLEEARSDAFLEELLARKADSPARVRTV